jgi:outer membrane protein assembly factor BamA
MPIIGTLKYYSLTADYRRYLMPVKPFTLAMRIMHYGRYGKGADDERLWPMYLGYDWYVRGYDWNSFTAEEVDEVYGSFDFNRLFGSKMMLANFELRFPLFGALGIGKGFYGIFPVDFVAFYDVGLAWDNQAKPWFVSNGSRKPVTSGGLGFRVNVLGYMVLGINYVKPFSRPDKNWYWQFSFYPGF